MDPDPSHMLPHQALRYLATRLPELHGFVVELGSGHGSAILSEMLSPGARLVSVEHDERFFGLVSGTTYIMAPLKNGWYDREALCVLPPPHEIAALIVDGPIRGRQALLHHLDLFPPHVPLLLDDVHRAEEKALVTQLAKRRRDFYSVHHAPCGRAFATFGWRNP